MKSIYIFAILCTHLILIKTQANTYYDNCFACILNGYNYCWDLKTCQSEGQTCPQGDVFTSATGCGATSQCGFGFGGIGVFGATSSFVGGIGTSGSLQIDSVSSNKPCVMTVINYSQ